eukprot:5747654-Alexandrium_andersonii.AAC.1
MQCHKHLDTVSTISPPAIHMSKLDALSGRLRGACRICLRYGCVTGVLRVRYGCVTGFGGRVTGVLGVVAGALRVRYGFVT